jgi:glucosamine-6-phosphate deaminase
MRKSLFDAVNLPAHNTHIPNGLAENLEAECRRYTALLDAIEGGLDIQLLGLGNNGHIGFNEPGDAFFADTHTVKLKPSTRQANARFFRSGQAVPRYAITMGVRPIMAAKHVVVLVSGAQKADIADRAFTGPICPQVPASLLQLHPHVTVLLDRAAASTLQAHIACI